MCPNYFLPDSCLDTIDRLQLNITFHQIELKEMAQARQGKWVQCDQIGLFLKDLAKNFLTKVAQIFGNFWGYFEKHHFLIKNCFGYFLHSF